MSTGESTTSDAQSEILGQAFANQLNEMREADEAFRRTNEENQAKLAGAHDAMLSGFMSNIGKGESGGKYPPEVIAIANALTAQPRLIPAVDQYLKAVAAELNKAIDKVIDGMTPQAPSGSD